MNLLLFILKLFKSLLEPAFYPEEAIQKLGEVHQKNETKWVLWPKNDFFSRVCLLFEIFKGQSKMTTIELKFKNPLQTTLEELKKTALSKMRRMKIRT